MDLSDQLISWEAAEGALEGIRSLSGVLDVLGKQALAPQHCQEASDSIGALDGSTQPASDGDGVLSSEEEVGGSPTSGTEDGDLHEEAVATAGPGQLRLLAIVRDRLGTIWSLRLQLPSLPRPLLAAPSGGSWPGAASWAQDCRRLVGDGRLVVYKAGRLSLANGQFQATAASAAVGAAVVGTGGAAAGLASGSLIGTALMLPLAPLTCGLSLPLGALFGGSCGLLFGSSAGSAAGSVGGALFGAGMYRRRLTGGQVQFKMKVEVDEREEDMHC